jgi:hypothetical protein
MTSIFNQLKGLALIVVLLLTFTKANAQTDGTNIVLRVVIDGVVSDYYSGPCGYGTASWGGAITEDMCAAPAWGLDITPDSLACDSIPVGQLTGKIGLIRRGVCSFAFKAFNAQRAGAVAVLVAQLDNTTTDDCFVQGMGPTTPFSTNTTVPVLFICRNIANQLDAAIKAGSNIQVCFVKPDVDIVDIFYPVSHVQTPVTQIATDTFGFSARIVNTSDVLTRTNVKVLAKVLKSDGTELFSATANVGDMLPGLLDTVTVDFPELYAPELPIGNYQIQYSTTANAEGSGTPVRDNWTRPFMVTPLLFANDNGTATTGFRPGTIGDSWAAGSAYEIDPGTLEHYQCGTVEFAYTTNATDYPVSSVFANLHLFRVADDILPDYSNFETADFFTNSLEWIAFGEHQAPTGAVGFTLQKVDINDINSSGPVKLDAGARYFVVAEYATPLQLTFHAFNQTIDLPGVSTIVYTTEWFLGGFGPGDEAMTRMYLELVNTTDEQALPVNSMNIVPNPVVDQLNLAFQFETPTDATITIADLNGRVITYQNQKSMTNETLHFPLSVSAGTYLARVATKEGTLTKQFVVVK